MARKAIKEEGILIGGSSGLALCGAIKFCKNLSEDKRVVVFNIKNIFLFLLFFAFNFLHYYYLFYFYLYLNFLLLKYSNNYF